MKYPQITVLDNPMLIQIAKNLPNHGHLIRAVDNLVALKIDDAYIHQLYPLLHMQDVNKPLYFSDQGIGAHISVIYPEEKIITDNNYLGQAHSFAIKDLLIAKINSKYYYVLTVQAPQLLALRKYYGLSEQLAFKGYWIDLHITIGVKEC